MIYHVSRLFRYVGIEFCLKLLQHSLQPFNVDLGALYGSLTVYTLSTSHLGAIVNTFKGTVR